MTRIIAWLAISIILVAFLALVVMTATGAPANAIIAVLFCLLVVPVILYAFLLVVKLNKRKYEEDE